MRDIRLWHFFALLTLSAQWRGEAFDALILVIITCYVWLKEEWNELEKKTKAAP